MFSRLLYFLFLQNVYEIKAFVAGRICMSAYYNSRTGGRVSMKFGVDLKSLEALP
jgi:hypothetical protein